MYEILIQTPLFIQKFAIKEIENFTKRTIKEETIEQKINFKIEFENKDEMIDFSYNIIHYSRTIENIYLKVDGKNVDLSGFNLTKRDYKLNKQTFELNPLIINYALYLLKLDENESFSIIDPIANLGGIIIESSLFNPRKPLNVKKRHELPIYNMFKKSSISKKEIGKNKYIGVVQDNKSFKLLKENINYSGEKIKLSQYELDWLDVKFKKNDIDYVFSYLDNLDDKSINEFLYQAEFISKKKICIISLNQIEKKYLVKYKLQINLEEKINFENKNFYIYIISRKLIQKRIIRKLKK